MAGKKQEDEGWRKRPYNEMTMNAHLRVLGNIVGLKNTHAWSKNDMVAVFEAYDQVNTISVRNLPKGHTPSIREQASLSGVIEQLTEDGKIKTSQKKDDSNAKRKREDGTETGKDKRAKVSSEDDAHVSPSDSGKPNDERAPRNVAGAKRVSKTSSGAGGVQKKSKQVEKPAATKPRSRQTSIRKPVQNKKSMDVRNPQNAESQDPSAPTVHSPFVTPGANPGDDGDSSDSDSSDSRDDNGDDGDDDGEDIEENDEDPEAEQINQAPSKNKGTSEGRSKSKDKPRPLGLHLGVHKISRHTSLDWDPLDESIPTSRLTWYEQEQRFRAQQEKAHKEAQEKGLLYNEGEEPKEKPKKEWDWKKQIRRK